LVDLSKKTPRERIFFKTKEEAEIFAGQKRAEYKSLGTSWEEMPEAARAEAVKLWKQLCLVRSSMTEAVEFYFKHAKPDAGERLVKDVVEEVIKRREDDGHSAAYRQVQRSVLRTFAKTFGTRPIHTIMSVDIEQWLAGNKEWSPRTRLNYQRDLRTLWNYSLRKRYATHNPLESLEKPRVVDVEPGILTVAQATSLLTLASKKGDAVLAGVAIGLFAGLRPAEIERLDWSEVDMPAKLIEVKAKKSKTRQRRHVTISDNLAAFLNLVRIREGRVWPKGKLHERVTPLAEEAGIKPWPHDALRHSFASYHIAKHQNAAKTALELGHNNEDMLFRNYRQLVKPSEAELYWQISPPVKKRQKRKL
jgi:integrase